MNSRLGWSRIFGHLIPRHANSLSYTLGGIIFVGLIFEAITGFVVQQFYHPHPGTHGAYDSIQTIMGINAQAFTRNFHYWMAQVILAAVMLHLLRVFMSAAYKKPRELQWVVGVGLFLGTYAFMFTGTVLKWDQEAVEALQHNIEIGEALGALGYVFLPQFAAPVPILTRIYGAHVTILPVLGVLLLGLHFFLVRVLGISSPNGRGSMRGLISLEEELVPFSTHVKRMLAYGLVLAAAVSGISLIWTAPLTMRGVEGIEVTKPPWPFLPLFPFEELIGVRVLPLMMTVFALALFLVPLIDRGEAKDPRKRRLTVTMAFLVLIGVILAMVYGALAPSKVHLG